METSPVILSDVDRAVRTLPELFMKAGFKVEAFNLVLIKPNICGLYHPSLDLLRSVVRFLEPYSDEIIIGETESMIHSPDEQFGRLGVNRLLEEMGGRIRTSDLSREPLVEVNVPKPHVLERLSLPRLLLDADLLVNVPKVGSHSTTVLTCALKNLFGFLPQKRKYSLYHPLGMDNVIADIVQVVKPDLNVVDAGVKVLVGTDALATDIVASRLIGLNPLRIKHLRLVAEDRGAELQDLMRSVPLIEV